MCKEEENPIGPTMAYGGRHPDRGEQFSWEGMSLGGRLMQVIILEGWRVGYEPWLGVTG